MYDTYCNSNPNLAIHKNTLLIIIIIIIIILFLFLLLLLLLLLLLIIIMYNKIIVIIVITQRSAKSFQFTDATTVEEILKFLLSNSIPSIISYSKEVQPVIQSLPIKVGIPIVYLCTIYAIKI